jgi:hypothetical protein
MTPEAAPAPASQEERSRRSTALRGVVVLNLTIVAISWSRWFSGDADHVGMVDRVLGYLRLGGFRVDVAWLVLSTVMPGLAFLYFASQSIRDREARINAAFCFFGVVAFCLFVYRALTTGVLDFG